MAAEQLVSLVAEHESLYGEQHFGYKNADIKDNIWLTIPERLGMMVSALEQHADCLSLCSLSFVP